ncbi:MAG: hypothetical protein OWS74_06725 [Firmicutes bacterium]|nr:hypothetical protein [Bacillota bacterium]
MILFTVGDSLSTDSAALEISSRSSSPVGAQWPAHFADYRGETPVLDHGYPLPRKEDTGGVGMARLRQSKKFILMVLSATLITSASWSGLTAAHRTRPPRQRLLAAVSFPAPWKLITIVVPPHILQRAQPYTLVAGATVRVAGSLRQNTLMAHHLSVLSSPVRECRH